MQVSNTLIAAQQAAREAQARFQQAHAPTLKANFAAALQETAKPDGFSPLPLKQTSSLMQPAAASVAGAPSRNARPGALLDIKI